MKLIFKQRIFSWFDSYDIFNENEEVEYRVKGKLAWGHKLEIYDKNDKYVGMVKEKIIALLPKFELYIGKKSIGEIKMKFTLLKPRYILDVKKWEINGDFLHWNYKVTDEDGKSVMTAKKRLLHFTDYYEIDIKKEENVLYALMIVLGIDAANCRHRL